MDLTNKSYVVWISWKNAKGKYSKERYYKDTQGWVKISSRGRKFRATAEQVLNHVLPAVAGVKRNVIIKVKHH